MIKCRCLFNYTIFDKAFEKLNKLGDKIQFVFTKHTAVIDLLTFIEVLPNILQIIVI